MKADRSYLDHNATTPMLEVVKDAMRGAMELFGNPSSLHTEGRAARSIIEDARRVIASEIGSKPDHVIFTSGGTEAAAALLTPGWAVKGNARHCSDLFALATEHACVLSGHRFPAERVHAIPVDRNGVIDLGQFDRMLAKAQFPLVALQHANNETGVIQPIAEAVAIARAHLALIVVDAVQSVGKIAVNLTELGVDALFLSAHKIGGPKGVGAIVLSEAGIAPSLPLIGGGGQQKGFRGGTENLLGIAGFAAAAREMSNAITAHQRLAELRDGFETALCQALADVSIFGRKADRLPNTSLFAIAGEPAESSLIAFDLAGFALSSGSACSSGKLKRSHVLEAMGVDSALGSCAIRLSLGQSSTEADLSRFLSLLEHRAARPSRKPFNTAQAA